MARTRTLAGDSHNFGRRVELRGERVFKPRTLLWEWLLLCAQSPLRRLLASAAERDGGDRRCFEFLPSLQFSRWRGMTSGEVEQIRLSPLSNSSRARDELAG